MNKRSSFCKGRALNNHQHIVERVLVENNEGWFTIGRFDVIHYLTVIDHDSVGGCFLMDKEACVACVPTFAYISIHFSPLLMINV